jgi:hypothetical protein
MRMLIVVRRAKITCLPEVLNYQLSPNLLSALLLAHGQNP